MACMPATTDAGARHYTTRHTKSEVIAVVQALQTTSPLSTPCYIPIFGRRSTVDPRTVVAAFSNGTSY